MTVRIVPAVVAVALVASAVLVAGPSVDDSRWGLSRTSVFDAPAPTPFESQLKKPGKSELLERSYPGAPPLVPHAIASHLPIGQRVNDCLDCHDLPEAWDPEERGAGDVPMPPSHYRDGGHAAEPSEADAEAALPEVDLARWTCVQCHVAPTDAPALVGNGFGALPSKAGRRR
jgi:cytochrome c-type protein NapB